MPKIANKNGGEFWCWLLATYRLSTFYKKQLHGQAGQSAPFGATGIVVLDLHEFFLFVLSNLLGIGYEAISKLL